MEQAELEKVAELFGLSVGGKKEGTWRIFFKGQPITTFSGKTSWSQKGHARNALYAHVARYTWPHYSREEGKSRDYFGFRGLDGIDKNRVVELNPPRRSGMISGKWIGDLLLESGIVEIRDTKEE